MLAVGLVGSLAASNPNGPAAADSRLRELPPIYGLIYRLNDADRRISTATQELIRSCMASQGLSYAPQVEEVTREQVLSELRPFGLETLSGATTAPPPPETVADERHVLALFGDPDQRVVARGERLEVSAPATGCVADAEHRLLGENRMRGTEVRLRLFDGERDAREQLDRDPAFRSANARWSACMRRAGIEAADPLQLLETLPADIDLQSHPAIRADVRCKGATQYLETAYVRLATLQRAWLDAHPEIPAEWIALREHQDAVARQVLGTG